METYLNETPKNAFVKYAGKYGTYSRLILVFIAVIIYAFEVDLFNPIAMLLNLIIPLVIVITFMYFGAKKYRKEIFFGNLTYMQALGLTFVIGVIAYYISALFSFVLNEWIDPTYQLEQLDKVEAYLRSMQEKSPMITDEIIEETIANSKENIKSPLKQLTTSLYTSPMFSVVLALVVSLFVKKRTNLSE